MNSTLLRHFKKMLVLVIGGTILLFGIILIFLPGPSMIVIPIGLAVLAIEFSWARKLFKKAHNVAGNRFNRFIPAKWLPKNPDNEQS
jgi:uncharacterized protein (TIGR02611 family)